MLQQQHQISFSLPPQFPEASISQNESPLLQQISNRTGQTAWLGVNLIDISPEIAKELDLKEMRGALIVDVDPNSPAVRAGIRGGSNLTSLNGTEVRMGEDMILEIDENIVNNATDIISVLQGKKVGERINLTMLRDNEEIIINNLPAILELGRDADAIYNRGIALYNLGRYEEAIPLFDKVLGLTKD